MKKLSILLLSVIFLSACQVTPADENTSNNEEIISEEISQEQETAYQSDVILEDWDIVAEIQTSKGNIKLKLYRDEAPLTTTNFIVHALNDYYKGTTFHRVIDDFMIQGGDPLWDGTWWESIYGWQFEDEFFDKIQNLPGTISMANSWPNTNGSQFFINEVNNVHLDGKHTVFGKVYEGMDVVHKITQVPLNGDSPAKEITIKDIVIFKYTNNELTDFEIQDKDVFTQIAIDTFNTKLEEAKEELYAQREAKKMFDSNRIAESGDVVEVKFEFTDIETNEIILSNMDDEVGAQFQIDGRTPMWGLNDTLKWMKIGETKTGTFEAEDAFGPVSFEIPMEEAKQIEQMGIELKVWNVIPSQEGEYKILAINESTITITNPHPAAGKKVNYTVELIYFVN